MLFTLDASNKKLTRAAVMADYAGEKTWKWLVFAYITDDNASITAKFAEKAEPKVDGTDFVLNGVTYKVTKDVGGTKNYTITVGSGTYKDSVITLNINNDNKITNGNTNKLYRW